MTMLTGFMALQAADEQNREEIFKRLSAIFALQIANGEVTPEALNVMVEGVLEGEVIITKDDLIMVMPNAIARLYKQKMSEMCGADMNQSSPEKDVFFAILPQDSVASIAEMRRKKSEEFLRMPLRIPYVAPQDDSDLY